jgi:hypothetical protein
MAQSKAREIEEAKKGRERESKERREGERKQRVRKERDKREKAKREWEHMTLAERDRAKREITV